MNRIALSVMIISLGLGFGTVPSLGAGTEPSPASGFSSPPVWLAGSMPADFAAQVLAEGREIYADLQEAQIGIRDKHLLDVRLALSDARKKLNVLGTPPAVRAVLGQLSIIEQDMSDRDAAPDPAVWDTLENELQSLPADSTEIRAEAKKAVRAARTAMGSGDRALAREHVATLRSILEYRFDVFPLESVQEDVASAWRAASFPDPRWDGIRQAVESATAQMRWLSRPNAHGLLTAYFAVARAALLLPGNEPEARRNLRQAVAGLSERPGAESLAATAEALAGNKHLKSEDIAALADSIGRQIRQEQQRAMAG